MLLVVLGFAPPSSTPYPYQKLVPKQEGPFVIDEVMGLVMFKLKLSKTWKLHLVFHAGLLKPYHVTKKHGPDYPQPPPNDIKGNEEWEIEAILKH